MKRPRGLCSHGMPTRLPHVEEGAWIQGSLAGSSMRDTRSDPCPQIVRPYAKASEPRMERKQSRRELQRCSVSITSSWVPTGVEFDADNSTA
jgi:hypothetical protein